MVASFCRIRAYSKRNAKPYTGRYYTDHTYGNYVARGGERLGEWCCSGARELPVGTGVIPLHFRRLLHQRHPHTGQRFFESKKSLSKAQQEKRRENKVACIDITFTPDKPHSAYLVYAPQNIRRRYERLLLEAVRETLESAELYLPLARAGKAGCKRLRAKILAALFLHRVNRNGDPGWHVHAVIPDLAKTELGWRSLNTKILRDWTCALGAVFRANLAHKLRDQLGLELTDVTDENGNKRGWAKLNGVPQDLCDRWSTRKQEINAATETLASGADPTPQARSLAAKITRQKKQPPPPEKELITNLRHDGAAFGFTQSHAVALLGRSKHLGNENDYKAAFQKAIAKLSETEAHFSHAEVVRAVAYELQACGIPARELMRRVSHDLSHSKELMLVNPTPGETRYATKATWELERQCDATADVLASRPGAFVPTNIVETHLLGHKHLSQEQANASRHLLTNTSSLKILTGVAGSGKTTTLNVVCRQLEKTGYNLFGGAISGAAKEELAEKAHIESRTLASWLFHLEMTPAQHAKRTLRHIKKQALRAAQGKKTYAQTIVKLNPRSVLLLDEAGMLGTATAYRIMRQVEKAGATLILVGDEAQIQPIEAGSVLPRLKKNYAHFHMTENWRQLDARDRQASKLIREGKGEESVKDFSDRHRLSAHRTRSEAIDALVSAYVTAGGSIEPQKHMAFTMTRAETNIVNQKIQAQRLEAGAISADKYLTYHNQRIHLRDRVMIHEPLRQFGLENGYRGSVIALDAKKGVLHVQFDQRVTRFGRWTPPNNVVAVPLKDLSPRALTLAYSQTTHKGQGQSCQHAYILLGGRMGDRELTYTQVTRGRQSTQLFVDELHAGENLQDISKSISRSRQKKQAHDIAENFQLTLSLEHDLHSHD
ncbi:MAG: MobF family relaxase [Pirellulaceae bacterium]